ncbi:hypothetical protein AB1Y20_003027 [Prymnesium parvum]|uniref:Sulfhydryl oxidase n=1 Tax=Prymnesium parvum TaxID=97485 RepID=A0AB34JC87_PRYPA
MALSLLGASLASLYDGAAHVELVRDFSSVSMGRRHIAIEFFAGWCGHCQAFAPLWRSVATAACAARPRLAIGAVDCVADFLTCQELGIDSFPTIRLFGPTVTEAHGRPLRQCVHGCRSAPLVLADILSQLPPGWLEPRLADAKSLEAISTAGGCERLPSGGTPVKLEQLPPPEALQRPVPFADITSAVVYGLERELPVDIGPERAERRAALLAWLQLLSSSFPLPENRAAMARLHRLVRAALAENSPVGLRQWASLLEELPRPIFPAGGAVGAIAWAACRGVSEEARGYPCALWLLFHSLVAHSSDATAAATLRTIRAYVDHFFGCEACRRHFVAMFDAKPPDVRTADAAALWLWRAHNAVNLRLNRSGEATVLRYGLPKVQWPPADVCPGCKSPSGRWREVAVLRLLRAVYCHDGAECGVARNRTADEAWRAADSAAADTDWSPSMALAIAACGAAVLLSCLGGVAALRQHRQAMTARVLRPVNYVPRVRLLSSAEESE